VYVHAAAWRAGFGTRGWLTQLLSTPAWIEGFTGAVWVHAMAAIPWAALIVGLGLWLVEPELEEQALLDGPPLRVLLRVSLPAALPAVGLAALWVAITTAGQMTVTDLFGVRTYAEEVYTELAIGQRPGLLIPVLLVGLGLVLCAGLGPGDRLPTSGRPAVFRLGRGRALAAAGMVVLVVVLAGVQLVNLCQQAGIRITPTETGWHRSWSAEKCLAQVAMAPWQHRRELGWSLGIGALAAATAVAVAAPLAWVARGGGWRIVPAVAVAAASLAIPEPVVALGIIELLRRPEIPFLVHLYDYSILAPWAALSVRGLPVAVLVLWHALRTVPPEWVESATTEGAGRVARLCRVALPARMPAVTLAWLAALVAALGELSGSILVAPPGVTMLSVRIFDMLHGGVDDRVAALCLALVTIVSLLAVGLYLVLSRQHRSRRRLAR
jgi:iron(III) transport system permease protein